MQTYQCDLCLKVMLYSQVKIKIKYGEEHMYDPSETAHKEKWMLCKNCANKIQYIIQKEILNEHGKSKEPGNGNVSESDMASEGSEYAGSPGLCNMEEITGEGYEQEAFLQHFINLRAEEEKRGGSPDDDLGMDVYP